MSPLPEGEGGYDANRTRALEARGWNVVRVTNEAVYSDLAGVLSRLRAELELTRG